MRTSASISCFFVLTLATSSAAEKGASPGITLGSQADSFVAERRADTEKEDKGNVRRIEELLRKERYREAIEQWEAGSSRDQRLFRERFAWDLAQAYIKQGDYEKAIEVYKPLCHFVTESVEQRVELGEFLLFGEKVSTPVEARPLVGEGQCTLCHAFSKGQWRQECNHPLCGPDLAGVTQRVKRLLASPGYLERRMASIQPEAYPGSGIATTVLEYLAESNVCPSCYVVPGYVNWPNEQGLESRMPKVHKPPISFTIDEMVAIDTWILRQDGEEMPSAAVMRVGYEKFLRPEDIPGNDHCIHMARLYDTVGKLDEARLLLSSTYEEMVLRWPDAKRWKQIRKDPQAFRHLKQRPDIVEKFPILLQDESS